MLLLCYDISKTISFITFTWMGRYYTQSHVRHKYKICILHNTNLNYVVEKSHTISDSAHYRNIEN